MAPRSLMVAYDFSEPSRRALEWARRLRARLHASVLVVHVDADPTAQTALNASSWATPAERELRMRRLSDELRREVSDHRFGPDAQAIQLRIAFGRPAEALCDVALEAGADLLIAGSSGKSLVDRLLLGSTTQELIQRCPIPVMTVH